jgi:hypothetical protein
MGDAGNKVRFGNCPCRHLASQGSIADDVQWRCSTSLGRVLLAFIGDAAKGAGFRSQEFREPAPPLGPQAVYPSKQRAPLAQQRCQPDFGHLPLCYRRSRLTGPETAPAPASGVVLCSPTLIRIPHDLSKDEPRICKRPGKGTPEVPARIVNRRSSRWITTKD